MFSVKALLFAISVAAICIGGIVFQTPTWLSVVVSLTLTILLIGAIRVGLAQTDKNFWLPFAVVGISYFAVVFLKPLEQVHFNMITTRVVLAIGGALRPGEQLLPGFAAADDRFRPRSLFRAATESSRMENSDDTGSWMACFLSAQCLIALGLACVSGIATSRLSGDWSTSKNEPRGRQ